jgi:hypothetical protein
MGAVARIITDFGKAFQVVDPNNEEIPEVMIDGLADWVSNSDESQKGTLVTLVEGFKHQFQEGDRVLID